MNLYEAIGSRQSIRKYTGKEVTEKLQNQILTFGEKVSRLNDGIDTELEILDNTKGKVDLKGLWKVEAPYYLVIYSDPEEGYARNAGYMMEQIVLYMVTKDLGSCYLGGSKLKTPAQNGKIQTMILAFGYPKGKLYRESPLAKRLSLNELCVFKEEVGEQIKTVLRAARLAPSALNSQLWRFIVYSDRIYVFAGKGNLLMRKEESMKDFSMGIMLSHIMLAAEEMWMELETTTEEQFAAKTYKNGEYIATLWLR
ncbi:MAG: nitroreductase family protein [Clostridium sp.]